MDSMQKWVLITFYRTKKDHEMKELWLLQIIVLEYDVAPKL